MKNLTPNKLTVWLFLFLPFYSIGQEFLIFPKRIEFKPNSPKIALLTVHNPTESPLEVEVNFLDYRMKSNGEFEPVNDSLQIPWSAKPYIRYYPRYINLAPNKSQIVKVQFFSQLPDSPKEFRSHLVFKTQEKLTGSTKGSDSGHGLNISLKPRVGLGIPLIIKQSPAVSSPCTFSEISLTNNDQKTLNFKLNRVGEFSCYGNISLKAENINGNIKELKEIAGVAVYTNLTSRQIRIPLDTLNLNGYKKLILEFKDAGSSKLLDSANYLIPKS